MSDAATARIRANPKYQELKRKRSSFGWALTICMFVVYYGYIALIAFNKEFLSQPIGAGVTTIGGELGNPHCDHIRPAVPIPWPPEVLWPKRQGSEHWNRFF